MAIFKSALHDMSLKSLNFKNSFTSPVHVVLVSLLVDQLSGLFLLFLVDQKKIVQSQGIFGRSLGIFGRPNFFLVYQNFFGRPNFFLVYPKFLETDQKLHETGQFFFGRPKKDEKKSGQLVDQ